MPDASYTVEPIPPFRQLVIDGMSLGARKHCVHGLVEVDITRAREHIRQTRVQTGEALSFTGFVVYCCARAVDEDKRVHAYRDWRNRLVLFDDVDISLPVERVQDGEMQNRQHLCLTVSFDHDIIDGGPAARFIQRFVELLQAGAGLT